MNESRHADFKIGDWWVHPQRNELERGEEVVHLEARSMGVLVCLAAHAPRVVSKERLLEEVWGDSAFVGDEVISHAIWELRKALGDSAREPLYIQTIPRKGYRLLGEVLRPQGAPLPLEGVQIDHYEIQEELGRGSMGVVFKALDRRLERPVAIKFLAPELTRDPGACRRFQREARLAASLEHPNLATVHEIGETSGGHQYIVTAWYRGGSLKERLTRSPLPADEAVRLGRQLAAGLGAAHQRGIIHRDVKPANVLLDEHGTAKLADFGIAKLQGATDLTRTGISLGTPAYKSPEQSRGLEVDQRTDIWSLGVVLFEMLTGRRPFDGEFDQAVVHAILHNEPSPLEDAQGHSIPEALRRIVAKAMAKEPAQRYPSAEELERDLEGLATAGTGPPAVGLPVSRRRARWLGLLMPIRPAFGASALVVVLLTVWLAFFRPGTELPAPPPQEARPQQVVPQQAVPQQAVWLEQARKVLLEGNDVDNVAEVERLLDKALEVAPDDPDVLAFSAHYQAEHARNSTQARTTAEQQIEKALEANPQPALAWAAQARLLLLDDTYEEAYRAALRAIELEPVCGFDGSCDLAYVWLAEALYLLERKQEALAILERGLQQGGGYIRCRLKQAQLLKDLGDTNRAATIYEDILVFAPNHTIALNDLAVIYLNTNRYEEAGVLLEKQFERTQDPRAALNLGIAYYGQRRWQEAIEAFLKADRLNALEETPLPTPAMAIGDTYLELGQPEAARPWFEKGLRIFDEWAAMPKPQLGRLGQRAVCLAKLGRLDEAEDAIRKLLQRTEKDPELLVFAARIAALAGNRDLLFERARQAVAAGNNATRLRDDPAFIPYREDQEYLRLLGSPRRP